MVDEGARQRQLDEAVQSAGDESRPHTTAHGEEEQRQHLEAHRSALRHGERFQQAESGGQRNGKRHLRESSNAPVRGVEVVAGHTQGGGRDGWFVEVI